jgi:uncharacterized membrane protein YgcG
MDELLGTTFARKSEYDLVKLLNIKDIGPKQEDQIRAIVTYFNGVKDQLSANTVDSAKGQEEILKIIKFLGGNPLTADLVVNHKKAKEEITKLGDVPVKVKATVDKKAFDDSITGLNTEIKNNFTGGKGGAGGPGGNSQGGNGGDAGSGGDGGAGGDASAPTTFESVMGAIKTAVEAIKTAVEKIEPKLPMAVVGA